MRDPAAAILRCGGHAEHLMLTVLGLCVGLIIGATGVGAGTLMTPALTLVAGLPPSSVVGVSLAYATITKLVSALGHGWNRTVDWAACARLAVGSVPGVCAAALVGRTWGDAGLPALSLAIGALLLALSVANAARVALSLAPRSYALATVPTDAGPRVSALVAGGFIVGLVTTLTSIGVGTLTAPLLLRATNLPPNRMVATNIVHACLVTALATAFHMAVGHIDVKAVGWILFGSIPGVMLGGRLSTRLSSPAFSLVVYVLVAVSGIAMMMKVALAAI